MNNQEYVCGVKDEQERQALLAAMQPYDENHWWESQNPKERAYYQTLETHQKSGIWFYAPDQYRKDLVALLGRPVYSHEFYTTNPTLLLQEVERAWRWGVGVTSEGERNERLNDGMRQIEEGRSSQEILYIEIEPDL